jgi:hypothetical protein
VVGESLLPHCSYTQHSFCERQPSKNAVRVVELASALAAQPLMVHLNQFALHDSQHFLFVTFSRTDFVTRGFAISLVSRASRERRSLFFLGTPNCMPKASEDYRLVLTLLVITTHLPRFQTGTARLSVI